MPTTAISRQRSGGVNPSGTSSIGGAFSETTFSQGIFDFIAGLRYDTFTLNGSGVTVVPFPPIPVPGPYTVDKSDGGFEPQVHVVGQAVHVVPALRDVLAVVPRPDRLGDA